MEDMLKRAAATPGVGEYSRTIHNDYSGGVLFPVQRKEMVEQSPGPGDYSPVTSSLSPSGACSFSEDGTPTHLETLIKRAAALPGPADYDSARSCFPARSHSSPSRLFSTVKKTMNSLRFTKMALSFGKTKTNRMASMRAK